MRSFVVALVFCAVAPAAAVTPVQKVIGMLDDMLAKGKKEKSEEQVKFSTYKQFCESTAGEKTRNIADGKDAIVQLKADILKAGADSATLAKEISEVGADIDTWTSEKAEADALRAKERADFEAVHADYSNAMDAVERALNVLRSSPGQSLAQVRESLLQVNTLDRNAKKVIMSFLQDQSADPAVALLEETQPQGNVKTYESSSGGVIDMVEKLGDKFKAERYQLEKDEAVKQHGHDMIAQGLTDNIERGNKQLDEKTSTKAARDKFKAESEGDLADTTAAVAADTQFLSDLTAECDQKASDFEKRQELRAGEIVAISKAIEIMSGSAVSGGTQHLPSLVQQGSSFAQFRSDAKSPLQHRVSVFLKDRAQRSSSRILSLVALRVEEDPFSKIKKMIQDMVTKLMEEANEEAEHKGFCDTEMGTNKNTRDAKSSEVAELTATIEELTAAISKLSEDAAALADAIATSDAAVAKATALRAEEKEKNTQTIADAKVAAEATARALTVLKDFYSGAAGATSVQGGSSTGVVGMLEVIQSDFTRLDTETTSAEDKAASEQEKFLRDSSKDKAVKSTDMKHMLNQKTQKEADNENAKKDLKGTQEELDAALEYYEKLKPSCVAAVETYEERVAKRNEEIESLNDALKILSGEA